MEKLRAKDELVIRIVIRIDDADVKVGCLISSENTMANCRKSPKFPQYSETIYLFGDHIRETSTW